MSITFAPLRPFEIGGWQCGLTDCPDDSAVAAETGSWRYGMCAPHAVEHGWDGDAA
ncbi:hypothetical protein ACIBG8_54595 [Nonomuraea sp. NPDC050556]|uniref:hypothetical protein n=1 Tax=Nonomuraea sp. NPDC050556 TaxID=3364369 RepID=UPI00378F9AF7